MHVTRHVSPVPEVVNLRVGEHPRFDRVVIDLRGVAVTGDYEGHVSFGLALRQHEDFRVFVLRQPNRIVIDLHH